MKYKIEIEITNIEVEDGYYQFNYKVLVNGKKRKQSLYSSDYCDWKDKQFKKFLEGGGALNRVFEEIGGD